MRGFYRLGPKNLGVVAAEAAWAESMGYDGVSSNETDHDPFLPLAIAATATSRITLETRVAFAFPRSPMVVAHTCERACSCGTEATSTASDTSGRGQGRKTQTLGYIKHWFDSLAVFCVGAITWNSLAASCPIALPTNLMAEGYDSMNWESKDSSLNWMRRKPSA